MANTNSLILPLKRTHVSRNAYGQYIDRTAISKTMVANIWVIWMRRFSCHESPSITAAGIVISSATDPAAKGAYITFSPWPRIDHRTRCAGFPILRL